MSTVSLTINGRLAKAEKGEMLLAVIRRMKIDIPALCHHDAVEPFGACRLCMVEISKPDWNGGTDFVTSCLYPAEDNLIVTTHSSGVNQLRRSIVDLFLARHPNSSVMKQLAEEYGVLKTSFEVVLDGDDCILCGLCTRICDRMGFSAISSVGRGHGKTISPPLYEAPPDCVGCLACAECCPTDFITVSRSNGSLTIWDKEFEILACKECGHRTITKTFAEYLSTHRDIPIDYFEKCDACRRLELTETMGKMASWNTEIPR